MEAKKKSFVGGALILGVAGILVKVMGAVFRIPIGNLLAGGGLACYQAVYPIYSILLALSTAGIPVAISRLVSERIAIDEYKAAHEVYRASLKLLAGIGIVTAAACFAGADVIMKAAGLQEAAPALRALVPALLLIPIMSSMRGYFQGMQQMRPTAISQLFEQLFRVVIGLWLAWFLLTRAGGTLEKAAAGATFGASAGAIAGLAVVYLIYIFNRKSIFRKIKRGAATMKESTGSIIAKILIIAIPITIGACIMPLMNLIDTKIVMARLVDIGYDSETSKVMYEQLSGFAGTMINFPQIIIQSVAISLVPAISMAFKIKAKDELRDNVRMGLKLSMLIAFPCGAGLGILAAPILGLLYAGQREAAVGAAPCLQILSGALIFLAVAQTLTGVLQGVGKQLVPVINLLIGSVFKIIFTYILVGIPALNVNGAAIGTGIAYIIAATLDFIAVRKFTGAKIDLVHTYVKPILATLVMGAFTWISYRVFAGLAGNAIAVCISIIVSVAVYGVMILATKAVTPEELENVPGGNKVLRLLDKISRK